MTNLHPIVAEIVKTFAPENHQTTGYVYGGLVYACKAHRNEVKARDEAALKAQIKANTEFWL